MDAREAQRRLGEILASHDERLLAQANAQIAINCALVGALVESGHLSPEKFCSLLARGTVAIYGDKAPPRQHVEITDAIAMFAMNGPRGP